MNTRFESKISILNETLINNFGADLNLARIKFISLFIIALTKVQTVGFEKLAVAFENQANTLSSLRRIQRFIAHFVLDTNIIARLVFALLPNNPPYRLTLDRTNWKFGESNINILVLAVVYQGVAFPILYMMMPKFGNSSTTERINLMERYVSMFGLLTIDCLLADREFIGEEWMAYLNENKIRYHIRIRDNFWVINPRTGKKNKASWLFNNLNINEFRYLYQIMKVNNQLCYLSGSKVKNKKGVPELQVIMSFNKPDEADTLYKERWQIETVFKALKTSGYNIEDTHLTDMERISKLLALIMIAFVWAYKIGIYLNTLKPIKIKNHGRKAYSLFKYGLNFLAKILNNNNLDDFRGACLFLSCT